ncbi:RbsD/FucU domain-containing protein [Akkermansia sp. N21116]|mgnify:CR=1 FL=1|jgi:L-fucose mutarotase/ribose pyranase (RbsD/FucU family)|uniref:RbsD/FucU domain-containing protein n=1 Tax=Akkermansia sp. N21116 TaxID=3040764 RepID=UPI00244E759C|nr:RbsD/FucU domain-containing protein [Akkermansia sp. N21116]WPX40557.1 RbsD/FucU domain-containing protein [Akkermansia sp. N21116]
MKRNIVSLLAFLLLACSCLASEGREDGLSQVKNMMPLLGHRNWVVVTDAAYPLQSNPGIKTIVVDGEQPAVVKAVLDMLAVQKHVRPLVYTDTELDFVREEDAPGINAYREGLRKMLSGVRPVSLPHEDIIAQLDEAASVFNVVIIKTQGLLPYTSVFFKLDCAYWTEKGEKRLRDEIKEHSTP